MASWMMDAILTAITPQIRQALAAQLGEPESAVQTGLTGATAATLAGLAGRAGDSAFLKEILTLARGNGAQDLLRHPPTIESAGPLSEPVATFLSMVFGSDQGQVAAAISQQAGLTAGSGVALLKVTAPRVLGYLGSGSPDTASLAAMLKAEKPNLQSDLPAALSGLLGGATPGPSPEPDSASRVKPVSSRWLISLATLGVLVLVWLLFRSVSGPKQSAGDAGSAAATTAVNVVSNAANSAWTELGEMTKVRLPDGSAIDVPAKGIEVRLVDWLNDPSSEVKETTWFAFDRLQFDTGKATLQQASQEQLSNIAAIMRAYPGVRILIGGYTDNSGDPRQNVKLSEDRADSVMAALTVFGVDPARMDARGFGQEHPIADNSSEQGRQKNRRISLRVTEKLRTNS